jgi:hypothetical protein
MRTAIFVIAGFALLILCQAVVRGFKPTMASAAGTAIPVFIVLWCLVAATNMWIGVNHGGYSVMEELPVFLIIFLPPVLAALLVKWHWR